MCFLILKSRAAGKPAALSFFQPPAPSFVWMRGGRLFCIIPPWRNILHFTFYTYLCHPDRGSERNERPSRGILYRTQKQGRTRQKEFVSRYAPRKISPLGGLAALLGRNDRKRDPFDFAARLCLRRSAQGDIGGRSRCFPLCHPELVAPRRHGRRRTAFAALPAAPAAPLPKKFFDTFWEPYFESVRVEGSLLKCKI